MQVAKPNLAAQTIVAAATVLYEKLDRIRSYIQTTYLVNGRLDPDHQFAVRVIESSRRELNRQIIVRVRHPGDPARKCAEIEMSVKNRDRGDVFRWYLVHAVGRLDCSGCDYDNVIDKALGVPVKVHLSRLCPICGGGIQHCMVVDSSQEAVEAVQAFWVAVGVSPGSEGSTEGLQRDGGGIIFVCDHCHGWQLETKPCG